MAKEYALYHGDEFKTIGTIRELAEYLKVKEFTVRFYATPTYRNRHKGKRDQYLVEKIEEDDLA